MLKFMLIHCSCCTHKNSDRCLQSIRCYVKRGAASPGLLSTGSKKATAAQRNFMYPSIFGSLEASQYIMPYFHVIKFSYPHQNRSSSWKGTAEKNTLTVLMTQNSQISLRNFYMMLNKTPGAILMICMHDLNVP